MNKRQERKGRAAQRSSSSPHRIDMADQSTPIRESRTFFGFVAEQSSSVKHQPAVTPESACPLAIPVEVTAPSSLLAKLSQQLKISSSLCQPTPLDCMRPCGSVFRLSV